MSNVKKGVVFLLLVLVLGVFWYGINQFNSTGKVTFDLDSSYVEGQPLDGKLKLSLNEGEFVPASSKVMVENNGNKYEYILSDLLSDPSEGAYYVEGTSISGSGQGYGGSSSSDFVLKILSPSSSSGSSSSSSSAEPSTSTQTTETATDVSTESNQTETTKEEITEEKEAIETSSETKEEKKENKEEKKEDKKSEESGSVMTGNVISYVFSRMTGKVSMNVQNEVKGKVSSGEEFVYELEDGESAEISEGDVNLKVENGKAIVTKSDNSKDLIIDLSKLSVPVEKGDLKISLVYNEQEITSLTTTLEGNVEENITVIAELTEEERSVLASEFGNLSVDVTDAKKTKNGVTVRFEIGEYWVEHSYHEMTDEELRSKVEKDAKIFLKDIANTLLKEEKIKVNVDGIVGSYAVS
ncbi:hypothetical protein HYT24_03260 [Candidatus Pacearchaeota archaeon]|nr:hypothetical protein [Candidatus Pacearchaeota archaeon]